LKVEDRGSSFVDNWLGTFQARLFRSENHWHQVGFSNVTDKKVIHQVKLACLAPCTVLLLLCKLLGTDTVGIGDHIFVLFQGSKLGSFWFLYECVNNTSLKDSSLNPRRKNIKNNMAMSAKNTIHAKNLKSSNKIIPR
jgi:hypothetical protein